MRIGSDSFGMLLFVSSQSTVFFLSCIGTTQCFFFSHVTKGSNFCYLQFAHLVDEKLPKNMYYLTGKILILEEQIITFKV